MIAVAGVFRLAEQGEFGLRYDLSFGSINACHMSLNSHTDSGVCYFVLGGFMTGLATLLARILQSNSTITMA